MMIVLKKNLITLLNFTNQDRRFLFTWFFNAIIYIEVGDDVTKLTDKEKKRMIADYIECQNYSEVARKYKRSVPTIKRVVLADEQILKKVKLKKEENTLDTLDYIMSLKEQKTRLLNKLLNAMENKVDDTNNKIKQNMKDLATAYGIILDKDMKILEIQRGSANSEQLTKVQELLNKLDKEAQNDIK